MSGQIHRCSSCGLVGHNVRRCKREPSAVIGPVPTAPAVVRGLGPGAGATEVPAINVDPARAGRYAAIEAAARARRDRGD